MNEKTDPDDGATWGRSRRMNEFRRGVIDKYKHLHRGNIIQGIGQYFGTVEVQWQNQGTLRTGSFGVSVTPGSPVVDGAFNLGIGEVSTTWFSTTGTPHVMNPSDTNLQNPGLNLFADELFIIEAVSARVRGMRVGFSAADIGLMVPAPTGGTLAMLQGNQMVRDQAGLVMPAELFNQYTDEFRMAKTLEEVASLHFKWADNDVGGSGKTVDVYIDSFLAITREQRDVKSTSGGAMTLQLPTGYIWCLDKQYQANEAQGGNGIFDAELHLDESVSAPFAPFSVFGPPPIQPVGIALYWEIRVYGTSLLPGVREYREQRKRRTV